MTSRRLAVVLLGISFVAACLPGALPPVVPARRALSLDSASAAPHAPVEGPLRVVFGGPQGETTRAGEVALVFSKPMRALGAGPDEPAPPAVLRPAVKGAFHWLGSTALRFDAAEPFAPATAYRVEVPAGTQALDGCTLADAFTLEFTTPRATVVSSDPAPDAADVPREATIALEFAQPVSDAEVRRAVTIADDARAPIDFALRRHGPTRVELAPSELLPSGERVHVRVDASLRAEGGELPAGKETDLVFRTKGPPFVRAIRCVPHPEDLSACDPDDPKLIIEASSWVSRAALGRALAIEPRVAPLPLGPDEDDSTDELHVFADFKPGVTYRVRVAPRGELLDDQGNAFVLGGARTFRFGHRAARVDLGIRGTYWSAKARHTLEVRSANATGQLTAGRRSLDQVLRALADPKAAGPRGRSTSLAQAGLDAVAVTPLRLDELLPGARGPVELGVAFGKRDGAVAGSSRHEVQITDLGLTARVGHGGAAVLVSGLDDAKPAVGSTVELYRAPRGGVAERLGVALTDALGGAAIRFGAALGPDDKLALVARRGDDWTYRALEAPRPIGAVGMLYTERALYRPGETVKVSGIFRVPVLAGLSTPRGGPVRLVASRDRDARIAEVDAELSDFGTFTVDVPIPRDAPLEVYRVVATAAGGEGSTRFRVAEYRPTEIAVEVHTDQAAHTRGDTLRCTVHGRYLHGGAMAGSKVTLVATRSPGSFTVPGLDDYTIRDEDSSAGHAEILRAHAELDASGSSAFQVPLTLPGQTGPEQVSCAAEALDLNRQALSATNGSLVHPGELYVALERLSSLDAGAAGSVGVLAVTPEGQRRTAGVRVDVAQRDGWERSSRETPLATCSLTTGASPVRCAFKTPKGARYVVVRGSMTDARGNALRASEVLYVNEPSPARSPPSPPPPRPRPYLHVSLDKSDLAVGDTAVVNIVSPFSQPATALLSVEREGILWQRVVPVPGSRERVAFPVTEAMIPNAQVSVMMVSGDRADRSHAWLEVDPEPKGLTVAVEARRERYRPGEPVDVEVRVTHGGAPTRAEVTLWAADEGTLSLIGYQVPRPLSGIFDQRAVLVTGIESRDALVKLGPFFSGHGRLPQVRMGATQSGARRFDFRQTAFFAAHLVTDDSGRVRRRFELPDGLTTYRVMAVAVAADDRFGSDETSVVTSLPLMARATLPRIVRAGDRFEASVVVTAPNASGDATVSFSAEGATVTPPAQRTIQVEGGIPAELRFEVRADRAGPARFKASATLGEHSDAMTLTREVTTPLAPETTAVDGETSDAAAEQLGDLSSIRPDHGGLTIELSASPLAGLLDSIEQLVEYPYGCTEQTASRLLPLLSLRPLAEALGVELPPRTSTAVTEAVARLQSHQRRDGGFGYWRESSRSEPWLTAWSLFGLGEARRRGVAVDPRVEARAHAYLKEAASWQPALATFAAELSALDGKPDAALHARLFAARAALPSFSRAQLLHAMALAKDDSTRLQELSRELTSLVRLDGAAARVVVEAGPVSPHDTGVRATAMLLRALRAIDPDHPLAPRLARGLLESRRGGRFHTTHDAAWALLALDELRRARAAPPDGVDARVFLGDTLLTETKVQGAAPVGIAVPAAALLAAGGKPLSFTSSGPLYYRARLEFARRGAPTAPVEAGLFLRRTVRPLDSAAAGELRAGQMVAVELDLATPSPRHAVVIDCPLPGGLEPADADLRLAGPWLRDLEKTWPATRRELRDDRVVYFADELPAGVATFRFVARASTPGVFVMPPARAEEMYAPDTWARTVAETVRVTSRRP